MTLPLSNLLGQFGIRSTLNGNNSADPHREALRVMPAGVLALLADSLADPLLELRLGEVIVVDPALVAGVVGRVNVDALDAPRMRGQERLESQQVMAFQNEVAVQARLLAVLDRKSTR